MIKKIFFGLLVILVVLAAAAATRPATFHLERSAIVVAGDIAHDAVNDFHRWPEWSPWEKMDPSMKKTFSGAPAGVGAEYSWVGNDKVGEGKMTILESTPERIVMRLEFIKPFAATNQTTFRFSTPGANSQVTWSLDGENNFMAKAMSLFMDMDKMVGPDFERGLQGLKDVTQKSATAREAVKKAEQEKATAALKAAQAANVAQPQAVTGGPTAAPAAAKPAPAQK